MIGCSVKGYTRACAQVVGGSDILLIGDSNDFDFTLGTPGTDGDVVGYSTITRRTGATAVGGALLYEITSQEETIGFDATQANAEGNSSSWDYTITARLAQMSQQMTNFNAKLDAAAVCCQILVVFRNNDGKIFVAGERYVGGARIPNFKLRQDGSKISNGKKFTDFNGQDLSLKGAYSRPPYEFTGGFSIIEALMTPGP